LPPNNFNNKNVFKRKLRLAGLLREKLLIYLRAIGWKYSNVSEEWVCSIFMVEEGGIENNRFRYLTIVIY
jgi:hypothetical protein